MGAVTAPELLNNTHEITSFDSGVPSLNEWLTKHALKNQNTGASRTFVICKKSCVVGYYALASGSIEQNIVPKPIARNMPAPIPVIILGRLAIDRSHQGYGLGAALLKDAMLRTLSIAQNVGVRGLLVHALSVEAKRFYLNYNFQESPIEPMTLLLPIKHLKSYFVD